MDNQPQSPTNLELQKRIEELESKSQSLSRYLAAMEVQNQEDHRALVEALEVLDSRLFVFNLIINDSVCGTGVRKDGEGKIDFAFYMEINRKRLAEQARQADPTEEQPTIFGG